MGPPINVYLIYKYMQKSLDKLGVTVKITPKRDITEEEFHKFFPINSIRESHNEGFPWEMCKDGKWVPVTLKDIEQWLKLSEELFHVEQDPA